MKIQKTFMRASKLFSMLAFFLLIGGNYSIFAQRFHRLEVNGTAHSIKTKIRTRIEFRNETNSPKRIYWLNENSRRQFYGEVAARSAVSIETFLLTPWLVTDKSENSIALYYPDAQPRTVVISNDTASGNGNVPDDEDDFWVEERYRNVTNSLTICRDQDVPRGFLILSVGNDMKCSNWTATGYNTYTIKRTNRTEPMTVCQNQVLPRNFVTTSVGNSMNCPNWTATGSNTMTIRFPRETEDVCSISQVPRGYVVISNSSNMSCPNWTAVGSNVKRIKKID